MNKFPRWFPKALIILTLCACGGGAKDNPKSSGAHLELQKEGIILDAKYDANLDDLIPGYKIISVGLTNNGVDMLKLNPLRDHWEIVDASGQKRIAYNSLRIKDPVSWGRLPDRVKELVEYPVGIQIGYSETIDLFFPSNLDLTAFRAISFYSADRKQNYNMLSMEDSREVPTDGAPAAETDPRFAKPKKHQ